MLYFNHIHRYRKLILILVPLVVPLLPLHAQVGLGLSPMRTELRMVPGAAYTGTLRLVNEGADVRARTSLLDFQLDSEQTPQFEEELPGEAGYSCRKWLTVNPMETEIAANSQVVVRYTFRVPADPQPRSYYCAAGFTSLPPLSESTGIGIRTAVRVISAFYIIVGKPSVQGTLSSVAMEHVPGSKDLRAVVVVENAGQMYFRPIGKVDILDLSDQVLESLEMNPVPILPERKQRVLFPLKKVQDGTPFKIRVRADLGTGEIQEGIAVIKPADPVQ